VSSPTPAAFADWSGLHGFARRYMPRWRAEVSTAANPDRGSTVNGTARREEIRGL